MAGLHPAILAGATARLRALIAAEVAEPEIVELLDATPRVTVRPSDATDADGVPTLAILLRAVTPAPELRQQPTPDPTRRLAAIAFRLEYAVSAAAGCDFGSELLLGCAIRAIEASPLLNVVAPVAAGTAIEQAAAEAWGMNEVQARVSLLPGDAERMAGLAGPKESSGAAAHVALCCRVDLVVMGVKR